MDEGIFRAMFEENGMPKLGTTATTLGIRKGVDIIPDQKDMVDLPKFQPGKPNGLSCSPIVQALPRFVLPVDWGGLNKKTVVWRIEPDELGFELLAKEDTMVSKHRHLSIGPAGLMTFDEFVKAIEATRAKWRKVSKN
jgi:hypothetical protein